MLRDLFNLSEEHLSGEEDYRVLSMSPRGHQPRFGGRSGRRLAKGNNLATVVTLMPNGQPQALPTWVDTDGEHVLINTEPVRQRAKNGKRDPRITVLIQNAHDPGDWAEIRGTVVETVSGQPARDHIDELSRRYNGTDYQQPIGPDGRLILKVAPATVNTPRIVSAGR